MIEMISTASLFIGTILCTIGAIGVVRMPDYMNRFHASTIIVTLGTLFILLPVGMHSINTGDLGYAKSAIILLFATWIAGAVGSHALAQAMFARNKKPGNLVKDDLQKK